MSKNGKKKTIRKGGFEPAEDAGEIKKRPSFENEPDYQDLFDKAPTVGEKYRVAMDAIGVDGDHFYDQVDLLDTTPAKAAKALSDSIGDWGIYVLDQKIQDTEPEGDDERMKWWKQQEEAWFPKETVRVMMLPVGHMCHSCGGSEAVLLCIDKADNVIKGKLVNLG